MTTGNSEELTPISYDRDLSDLVEGVGEVQALWPEYPESVERWGGPAQEPESVQRQGAER